MRIHYLQHVPFESPSAILNWAERKNHEIKGTLLYKNQILPKHDEYDMLIILGGPMGVYDEKLYTWLKPEKQFINQAIKQDKLVLGICLGAQLIADVLGAAVYQNEYKEIGIFPLSLSQEAQSQELFADKSITDFNVIHWHGDTFDLPQGGKLLASSQSCRNQAFVYNQKVFGLQFHLEMTRQSLTEIIKNCRHELVIDKYVQDECTMLNLADFYLLNQILYHFLDKLANIEILFKD